MRMLIHKIQNIYLKVRSECRNHNQILIPEAYKYLINPKRISDIESVNVYHASDSHP